MPQMRYSWVQKCVSFTTAGMVALPTTATIRLPITGPLVQNPMAGRYLRHMHNEIHNSGDVARGGDAYRGP
jgi:hypothetical protein